MAHIPKVATFPDHAFFSRHFYELSSNYAFASENGKRAQTLNMVLIFKSFKAGRLIV
ncbi:protein of unknown function (plasmid) [Caballeronia sp. S22]